MTVFAPTRHPASAPRAGRREWIGLAVLFLPTVIVAIDNTVLGFALPAISAALTPSATQSLWLVDIYPLVLAGLLVTMGTLGDRIGRRRTLLVGVAGFGVVSLAAAFAADAVQLVAARALLGFFGAMLMPATLALLRTLFLDRAQRRLAVAIWATGFAAGAALGPIVGGVLLEHLWWGSVFLVNVPVMIALLVLGVLVLRESRPAAPGSLDPLGVVLSLLAMVPTVLAIKLVAHDGITGSAVLSLMIGVVAGVLFVRRARARLAAGSAGRRRRPDRGGGGGRGRPARRHRPPITGRWSPGTVHRRPSARDRGRSADRWLAERGDHRGEAGQWCGR